jgi:hypothetical protein
MCGPTGESLKPSYLHTRRAANENEQEESLLFPSRHLSLDPINKKINQTSGSMFCLGMSAFGFLFMGLLGHLLSRDYQCVLIWSRRFSKREKRQRRSR